jgi:hypothetical protein
MSPKLDRVVDELGDAILDLFFNTHERSLTLDLLRVQLRLYLLGARPSDPTSLTSESDRRRVPELKRADQTLGTSSRP